VMKDGGMGNPGGARHILKPQTRHAFSRHAGFCRIQNQGTGLFRLAPNTFFLASQVLTSLLTIL